MNYTAAALLSFYHNLFLNAFFQFSHMRDNSHQTISPGQIAQHSDSLIQRFFVQRAKSLIHKHGVQTDAAGGLLNLIRQPQRQRQRRLERLTAG